MDVTAGCERTRTPPLLTRQRFRFSLKHAPLLGYAGQSALVLFVTRANCEVTP